MLRENNINNFVRPSSGVLPVTGDPNKIYIIPSSNPTTDNLNEEWYYDSGNWELLGGSTLNHMHNATDISFDDTISGLGVNNVQDIVDKINIE